ncbi:MAG: right-handed parallel beta-helix repeat-containing protein [Actinomycetota bacterium]
MHKAFVGLFSTIAVGLLAAAGSVALDVDDGPDRVTLQSLTCSGVHVQPGTDLQHAIDVNPEGTRFCFEPGRYRLSSALVPKNGQRFIGMGRVVLSGARRLSSWANEGNVWRASIAINQSGSGSVDCDPGYLCQINEDVTFDDRFLVRAQSLQSITPGRYFIDYANDLVYVGTDPVGHEVEVAVATQAFNSRASNVVVRRLVIEKFANAGQTAAISAAGTGWLIEKNQVRLNHGIGICAWAGASTIRSNHVHHNGEMGLCGQQKNLVVARNEIAFNGPQEVGFNIFWEGGGTKFVNTNNLVVRGNYSHDNRGSGLWTDYNNVNVLYENNRVVNNTDAGILHEIGCAATIRNNYASDNGFDRPSNDSYWGGGIVVWQSPDVEIYGNTVENNKHGIMAIMTPRGSGACGTFEIRNLYVHDNTIRQPEGRAAGLALYNMTDSSFFTSKNNRFRDNDYFLGDVADGQHFVWSGGYATAKQWKTTYGHDVGGSFDHI